MSFVSDCAPPQVYSYDETPQNPLWACTLPTAKGLYNPELEKDACGVGFTCHLKGQASHKIVLDCRNLLCNMTHRGGELNPKDGDGAGVLCLIPHKFFTREFAYHFPQDPLPPQGQYGIGNVFFKKGDELVFGKLKQTFEGLATECGLRIIGWRAVPHDSLILGPALLLREPLILQPAIVLADTPQQWLELALKDLERRLYVLRKRLTHVIGHQNWFYVCLLSLKTIVYKGQLAPNQVYAYFHDLVNCDFEAHFALVHLRFSTNTFPSWDRAQPLRLAAHNGEINTLRGNKNWMRAKEGVMHTTAFDDVGSGQLVLEKLFPIIEEGGSDSAAFDNVLELLVLLGTLLLPEAVMVMIPEAWQNDPLIDPLKKAFYEWAACLMEPWDGPALFTFADDRYCGANLDRNGLRPCRYYVTTDDRIICASEVGVIDVDPETVLIKGRLQPGRMLLVDTHQGRIVDDTELKQTVLAQRDFRGWIMLNMVYMDELMSKLSERSVDLGRYKLLLNPTKLGDDPFLNAFGYSHEQLGFVLGPMAEGKEALGSMGNDNALACVLEQPKLVYEYFKQLFAQVTNPPIDPIREEIVMLLECYVGPQGNLLEINPKQTNRLHLKSPILANDELAALTEIAVAYPQWKVTEIDITFPRELGIQGYIDHLDVICDQALRALADSTTAIILTDRATSHDRVPVSALVAVGAVHHHLVRQKQRLKVALVVETAEAREVHHMCCLLGYGVDAINPYLAIDTLMAMRDNKLLPQLLNAEIVANFRALVDAGILKVMLKMGISTLASYKGAQIFEALGIDNSVIDRCFAGTALRIKGVTFEYIAQDAFTLHERGFPDRYTIKPSGLPETGEYHWRDGGDAHVNDPAAIASVQDAVKNKSQRLYDAYSKKEYEAIRNCTLRGLLDFDYEQATPVPLDQVEPWTEIVRRFFTGAMLYGSISMEAHSTLAVAMNRLGGKLNTGEGGEDPARLAVLNDQGDTMRLAIKQIASGRFGVTLYYLADADELQIKMAQGAKPGEGGELPGHKVSAEIGKTRRLTPGVGLISPPPHHDIYSIEDLKQLLYDLKCANPRARTLVKLVLEVGVGIVAAGVAKAGLENILISGGDGGTGAAKLTSIKYAGLPWELGLAESHQTLVLNDLRGRVILQTDGQLRTGRDVAIACLLGAEEWGFATTPLIAMGCIMMRKCHLGTCPVGIATQDPELRAKFDGTPEHVINFFYYVAQELRLIMAQLGFRTINDMVGHTERLKVREDLRNVKNANIDLTAILTPGHLIRPGVATHCVRKQDHKLHVRLDNKLIDEAEVTLEKGLPVTVDCDVVNTDRSFGTTLLYRVLKIFGEHGLPHDTIHVNAKGLAGQSFGAFLAHGVTLELEGDANDYLGKGLSGGRIIVYPPRELVFNAEDQIIAGNTCFFGATLGTAFIRGIAAERFAVRNSGATIVAEGTGDHGCEYMSGGRVVILGLTGRNFAAGMCGGIAYVLDMAQDFSTKVNKGTVGLYSVTDPTEIAFLRGLIEDHRHYTRSEVAEQILGDFNRILPRFIKVLPHDYKKVLDKEKQAVAEAKKQEVSRFKILLDPLADATNGEALKIRHNKLLVLPAKEPPVADVEDTILLDEALKKPLAQKLDKVRGFMKYKRRNETYRSPKLRTSDWNEMTTRLSKDDLQHETARCMDCGVPFCTSDTGCPISNVIPKWNELVFKDRWYDALQRLLMTNNFPEFTGRICPAPCMGACVLGINNDAVNIKLVECAIIDHGFEQGWIVPQPPKQRTGKLVAIVGLGPAGLAAADQLNRAGHQVTVFERSDRAGGLLMYGIPNMKLDKRIVKRRTDLMEAEGVEFRCNVTVGEDVSVDSLKQDFDAVVFAVGLTIARDLNIPGRLLNNIDFAMKLLQWNTQALLNEELPEVRAHLEGKNVIVIGGGDTGNDCLGTATRHGAKLVTNFELLPTPAELRPRDNPWPQWPRIFRVDYGHAEVAAHYGKDPRQYSILLKEFVGDEEGNVTGIKTVRVEWKRNTDTGAWQMLEVPGSEELFEADVVLLLMGFIGPEADHLNVTKTKRGTIATQDPQGYAVEDNVFAAGDCRRGQSLVVWGIQEGRQCAREVDLYLMGETRLPGNGSVEQRDYRLLEELADKV